MNDDQIKNFLTTYAHAIIAGVAVQTHTDWSKYLKPITEKYVKYYKDKLIK